MKNPYLQSIVTLLALASLLLLADPFMNLMPTPAQMAVLLLVAILLSLSVAFVLTEKAEDEREELHRLEAGRIGYSCGLVVLIIALIVQGLAHDIDIWIIGATAAMLMAKVVVRLYDAVRK